MPGHHMAGLRARPSPPQPPAPPSRYHRSRLPVGLPLLALVPAVLVAGFLYLQLNKRVTLMVDGERRTVSTFAGSVADLLDGEGIPVDEHDRIAPTPDTALADGMLVKVLQAKEITLLMGDQARTVYVTGQTVDDVLEQVNVRAAGGVLEPSRSAAIEDGDVIEYRPAVAVTLSVDGETRELITNTADVGYLLDSMGVVLRKDDRVEPPLGTELTTGTDIRVIRVNVREVTTEEEIPYGTDVVYSREYPEGSRRVQTPGVAGLVRTTYRLRTENGREVARTELDRQVIRPAEDQVVVVGTRPPESQSGIASWYHRDGLVAAHQTLPMGTSVTVTNVANGRSVTVVINDRGPFVEGRIIDLSDDAFARIASLGSGTAQVRITW
ncbi:MAG TPA: septal ring lytic transglycosylase RlpA family protein [Actinomycetota bacterium]|nr:septal ring lytic transglycosylase RlpA family protein [Actinomycetota bacterium]